MMRLQKYLSMAGVCSRRAGELMMSEGRVSVNGNVVTEMGFSVDPERDKISVDGTEVTLQNEYHYIAYNKPRGVTSTLKDEYAEITISDVVPSEVPLKIAGRLDKDTSGLMLLSNDGTFIQQVTHPSFTCEKEYLGTTKKPIDPAKWNTLLSGVTIEGIEYQPCVGEITGKKSFRIILGEGKKRQIRNMMAFINAPVDTLQRVRVGIVELKDLPEGHTRPLHSKEVEYFLHLKKTTKSFKMNHDKNKL